MFAIQTGALAGRLVCSPSDLVIASQCEYGFLARLDEVLGRALRLVVPKDEMLARAAELGDMHETEELNRFLAERGEYVPGVPGGVAVIERPDRLTAEAIDERTSATAQALDDGASVVFQPVFFDAHETDPFAMYGMADFLERHDADGGGYAGAPTYEVIDTKLARSPKPQALLQIAWYAEQVERLGHDPGTHLHLLLGTKIRSSHPAREIRAVLRERMDRLAQLVSLHEASGERVQWTDPRWSVCGACDYCQREIDAHDDLLKVAGLTRQQRDLLRASGVQNMPDLAATEATVPGLGERTWQKLRLQAQLQTGTAAGVTHVGDSSYLVVEPEHIQRLPASSPGDMFFDFEGDPLWRDHAGREWNLDYLFGWVTPARDADIPEFHALWADDLRAEKQALIEFMAYVQERRSRHPDMHIYHYAAYERTHLLSLALRHQVCEQEVDDLLRSGVLVDLYPIVRQALRISASSYSIKKMEPLYMGEELRDADVEDAGASVVAYALYAELKETDPTEAATLKDSILAYNHDDCLSTLRLRDWLRSLVTGEPEYVAADTGLPEPTPEDPVELALRDMVPGPAEPDRTPEEQAVALLGAAVGYHRREAKPFWWEHFARLSDSVDEWPTPRNALVFEDVEVTVPWVQETPRKSPTRVLRATAQIPDGSKILIDGQAQLVYEDIPGGIEVPAGASRAVAGAAVSITATQSVIGDAAIATLEIVERKPKPAELHKKLPMALVVTAGPSTTVLQNSLRELGAQTLNHLRPDTDADASVDLQHLPQRAAIDLVLRRPPRLARDAHELPAPQAHATMVDTVTEALRQLDSSYLAVQGPPGTGKTHLATRVIAALINDGWRIGVTAQSHAVIENVLRGLIKAGCDPARIAKPAKSARSASSTEPRDVPWRELSDANMTDYLTQPGIVVGGTAWFFSNEKKVPADHFDLLVVDEAGQFSLANTMATSRAAQSLLLLGDPQQLGQVVTGSHPEPVDESALGWLLGENAVIPSEFGYFLDRSWRMHPDVCAVVSELAYDGQLSSAPSASERRLAGIAPGVHTVWAQHYGNSVSSPEEAAVITRRIADLLGTPWHDPRDSSMAQESRPLEQSDILIVAAYNAQVVTLKRALDHANLPDVRAGTVDKFQGQEAPVVFMSMAASDASQIPRGVDFLIDRNRLNVAISRAQWCTFIVRSPGLSDVMPASVDGLLSLGAFIEVCRNTDEHAT